MHRQHAFGLRALTALGVFALSACAGPVVTSLPINFSADGPQGELAEAIDDGDIRQVYTLPRTFMRLQVITSAPQSRIGVFNVDARKDVRDFPDARHVYAIRHNSSFWSDDDIKIEVGSEDHYIKKITSDTTDRSLDIARLAGTTILRAVTGIRDASVGARVQRGGAAPSQILFEDIIDPTVPSEVARVNKLMEPYCVRIEVRSLDGEPVKPLSPAPAKTMPGIMYRVRLPYKVNYFEGTCNIPGGAAVNETLIASILLLSGNQSPLIPMSLERAYFVQVTQEYVYGAEGVNKSSVKRPSAALSFMQLPLDIVDAILNVPVAGIKQLYTDEKSKADLEKGAYESQIEAINQRIQLLEAQKKLNEAMGAADKAPDSGRQTIIDGKDKVDDPGASP